MEKVNDKNKTVEYKDIAHCVHAEKIEGEVDFSFLKDLIKMKN